jgi:hypothetical protein
MAEEAGISVERDSQGSMDYGDAFEQVADAAEEEARASGGRSRRRTETSG